MRRTCLSFFGRIIISRWKLAHIQHCRKIWKTPLGNLSLLHSDYRFTASGCKTPGSKTPERKTSERMVPERNTRGCKTPERLTPVWRTLGCNTIGLVLRRLNVSFLVVRPLIVWPLVALPASHLLKSYNCNQKTANRFSCRSLYFGDRAVPLSSEPLFVAHLLLSSTR